MQINIHKLRKYVKIRRKDTTTVPLGTLVILAPGDVNPGHIILAPLRINLIAPLSACCQGHMKGSAEITHKNSSILEIKWKYFFRKVVTHIYARDEVLGNKVHLFV